MHSPAKYSGLIERRWSLPVAKARFRLARFSGLEESVKDFGNF
jgi:hypothetical protein